MYRQQQPSSSNNNIRYNIHPIFTTHYHTTTAASNSNTIGKNKIRTCLLWLISKLSLCCNVLYRFLNTSSSSLHRRRLVLAFLIGILITFSISPYIFTYQNNDDSNKIITTKNVVSPTIATTIIPPLPTTKITKQPTVTKSPTTSLPTFPTTNSPTPPRTPRPTQLVISDSTLPWTSPITTHVWLDRELNTGFGDRFCVLACAATMASMFNKTLGTVWDETNAFQMGHNRDFRWNDISPYLQLPYRLEIYGGTIFDIQGKMYPPQNQPSIVKSRGIKRLDHTSFFYKPVDYKLPSKWALDSIYTHCWRTFIVPNQQQLPSNFGQEFEKKFRQLGKEFDISLEAIGDKEALQWVNEQNQLGKKGYLTLHIRWGDKKDGADFCTLESLKLLTDYPIVLVSDEPEYALTYIGDVHSNIKVFSNLDGVSRTAMRDLAVLLRSRGIIQHCTGGWSSFSSFPAMIRNIPLLQTYVANPKNMEWDWTLLDIFAQVGPELPQEIFSCRSGKYNVFGNESIVRFKKWVDDGKPPSTKNNGMLFSGYRGLGEPFNWPP
jgi:hypothetical protein